jgi:hypothetical protein
VFGIIMILLTFDMKIDAFGGRLDVNTRQTKQEPVRIHSVVFKQSIYEAVLHNDQDMDLRRLMVVRYGRNM